jgi:hypothetical protein
MAVLLAVGKMSVTGHKQSLLELVSLLVVYEYFFSVLTDTKK